MTTKLATTAMEDEMLRKFLPAGDEPGAAGLDGYRVMAGDPLAEEHALVSVYLEQARDREMFNWGEHRKIQEIAIGRYILALSRIAQAGTLHALTLRLATLDQRMERYRAANPGGWGGSEPEFEAIWPPRLMLFGVMQTLMRRKLPLGASTLGVIFDWFLAAGEIHSYFYPLTGLKIAVEEWCQRGRADQAIRDRLRRLQPHLTSQLDQDAQRCGGYIANLLGTAPPCPIRSGEAWSNAALEWFGALIPARQAAWTELLTHCANPLATVRPLHGGQKPSVC